MKELPLASMIVNGSEQNEQFYKGPSKDASYQVSIHLAKRFQRRRFFRNQPIRNKNCLQMGSFKRSCANNDLLVDYCLGRLLLGRLLSLIFLKC
jgi:hypothetical protein